MSAPVRGGFALLAVLWVLTTLTVLTGVTVAVARTGAETTRNRILLARAGWAREACVDILLARYAQDASVRAIDTVDLGRGTWCSGLLDDVGSKVNVNLAKRPALMDLLLSLVHDSLKAASLFAVLDSVRRATPLTDVSALGDVPGFDSSLVRDLTTLLTTDGSGAVDVNSAPAQVLATVPGLSEEAVVLLLERRMANAPIRSAQELAGLLSRTSQEVLADNYRDFTRAVAFAPAQFQGVVRGGIHGGPIRARVLLTLIPAAGRLAVVRRETE